MIRPRLKKVLWDVAFNKTRTLLVVLSIAIGVAGVGAIGELLVLLNVGMKDSIERIHPPHAAFSIAAADDALVERIRHIPGVSEAEGRTVLAAKIESRFDPTTGERKPTWTDLELSAVSADALPGIDRLFPWEGSWPPEDGGVYLEHLSAKYLDVRIGDEIRIETPDGKPHMLKIRGLLQYPGKESTTLSGVSYAFVTQETMRQMGLPGDFNTLYIRTDDANGNPLHRTEAAADRVRTFLGEQGVGVFSSAIPDPGKHWGAAIVDSMGSILQSLGLLVLLLSATLVTNTVFALLSDQIRQLGIMKVVGASPRQLSAMYLLTILLYGLLGLLFGIPLGLAAARAGAGNSINLLNFDGTGYSLLSPQVVLLQAVIGLVVPIAAAAVPIVRGIRITEREAISGVYGKTFGTGLIDRWLERVRGLPRPFLLSLRNTFRKKGRLLLTLITFGLGGAIVVSVFSVYASLNLSLTQSMKYMKSDFSVTLAVPAPAGLLKERVEAVAGVQRAETWGMAGVQRVREDGSVSGDLLVAAPPVESQLVEPDLVAGRWLRADDRHAIVMDQYLLDREPDLRVGQDIVLKLQGKAETWHIVGMIKKPVGSVINYIKPDDLAAWSGESETGAQIHVVTERHDRSSETDAATRVKASLKEAGIPVASTLVRAEFKDVQEARIQIVVTFILIMAVLMILVSGLGLMGTMSLNVLERTREIGVLRSIGAGDRAVWGIVVGETLTIGGIGWMIGALLSWPVSAVMCRAVGVSLYKTPLEYVYPWHAPIVWLIVSLGLAVLSGWAPAWKASRISVRDAINYE